MSLKSQRQIQTEMLSALISSLGLNDINPGSVLDVITNATAQQDFSLYYRIAQLSRLSNIDSLTEEDLELKAFEFGLTRGQAAKTIGLVSILRPLGFQKVSTQIYSGSSSPIAGDTQLDVNDASNALFGTSGTLIVGRGTSSEEEVTYSVAPANNTNFFSFTLDIALANDHGTNETVILKQGVTQTIVGGTVVRVLANGAQPEILFEIIEDTNLLAGELEVANVEVRALLAGSNGNIPILSIEGSTGFSNPPFSGARVQNNAKFTTGRNRESDNDLRDRVKTAGDTLTKGVKNAILNAIVGLVDPDTAKRVVSANVILPLAEESVKIYLDDGTGFEPSFTKQGLETLREDSTGGETRFQLVNFPITKAFVESNNEEPYNMSGAPLSLNLEIGGVQETLTFNLNNFRFPSAATAEEIVERINDTSFLVEARTSQSGKKLIINSKLEINETVEVLGGGANSVLGFPLDKKRTLGLYKNNQLLEKDGVTAFLDSQNEGPFNLSAISAFPHTLTFVVDGKPVTLTATITLADVVDPASVTSQEIVNVINREIPGLIATVINNGAKVRVESNLKLIQASKIQVSGGTANSAVNGLNFVTTQFSGKTKDYAFNKELGLIELTTPLVSGDSLSAGTGQTRAYVEATIPQNYSPVAASVLSLDVDGGTYNIPFDGASRTAIQMVNFLNNLLIGATAEVFERQGQNFIRIRTNTFGPNGSIQINAFPFSTALASFGFPLTESVSIQANTAFKISSASGPFSFAENDNLVVIVDQDSVNASYNINLSFASLISSAVDATDFSAITLGNRFLEDNKLNGFDLIFTSGVNTYTGVIESVTLISGNTYRYEFTVAPTGFANVAVGDQLKATLLTNSQNNGNFIITAKGVKSVDVVNPLGIQNLVQTGAAILGEKRAVVNYVALTGDLTASITPFSNTPGIGDTFVIVPKTINNLVTYLTNKKITPLSIRANIEGVDNNTKLQISTKASGSDGALIIPGGRANNKLIFSTNLTVGNEAYSFYTGLLALAHKTVYGDDEDLVSFPGVGAAGINFEFLAPTVKEIFVSLDVTLRENFVLSSLENEIKSRITGYINNLKVGEDVILERIRAAVIIIPGILDVSLSDPISNIAIAENELARISQNSILVG